MNLSVNAQETDEDLQKKLDANILGPWILVTDDKDELPSNEEMEEKLPACTKPLAIRQLKFEEGAARSLPEPEQLVGDVIYFRNDTGLHRFDAKTGVVILLSKPAIETVGAMTFWGMASVKGKEYKLNFQESVLDDLTAKFMLENNSVYLNCNLIDQINPTSEDNG